MTLMELLETCRKAGIILTTADGFIDIDAPGGTLTADIRAAIQSHKPVLLEVLWRLAGMQVHPDPVPTARSAREAPGGPGRCFSCGDAHEHPEAYGRCQWCDIAVEAYYTAHHAGQDAALFAADREAQRRTA